MALALVGLVPIELPVGRKLHGTRLDPRERPFAAAIERDVEHPLARHTDVDFVAFLQLQNLDD